MFPGKSNSLDALCKRLEVDNAMRTLHGALLDAGLLAEVYIRMTRGQESLVIDDGDSTGADFAARPIDFRRSLSLVVIAADEETSGARRAARRDRQGERRQAALAGRGGSGLWHGFPAGSTRLRAVSSAVEHCLHTAGVAGSNPAPPTSQRIEFVSFPGLAPGDPAGVS